MKKTVRILFLAFVLPVFATSAALAAGGKIRFGNLAIVPSLGVDEVYDDNIYFDKRNKESDWITHIRPGLMLDYTIQGRGKFQLGYKGDYAYYSANKDNDWKHHKIFLDLDYLSPGGLIVKVKNDLVHTEDPFGDQNEYKLGVQTERWINHLQSAVGFKFSNRFRALAYYNYYRQDYRNQDDSLPRSYYQNNPYLNYYGEDFAQDYYYNEAGLGVETKVTHKTWAFLRYYTGSQQYFTHRNGVTSSNDASYDWQRIATGLTWDEGGRFKGELNFGYQWNSYDNSRDRNGFRYKDENNVVAATRISFRQAEGRSFYFTANRGMYQLESGISGYNLRTAFGIGVEQKIRSKFLLTLGYVYERNKWNSEGSSSYYSFSNHRRDTVHRVRTHLKYSVTEYLSAGVFYNFIKDHSSESRAGYTVNRFGISIDFKPAAYH